MAAKPGGRGAKTSKKENGRYFNRVEEESTECNKPVRSSADVRLEQSTLDYFSGVQSILEANDFQDAEDKELFITNVLRSIKGDEWKLALNKKTSKILETFLGVCSEKDVLSYAKSIEDSLYLLSTDRCGSHVLQTLLETSLRLIRERTSNSVGEEESHPFSIEWFVRTVVELVCSDFGALIVDEHASHVICSVIEVLSGRELGSHIRQSKRSHRAVKTGDSNASREDPVVVVSEEFTAHLKTLTHCIVQLDDLTRLAKNPCSSVVLQFVLLALHKVDEKLCKKVTKTILKSLFPKSEEASDVVLERLKDQTSAHLIETAIKVSTQKCYRTLFKKYFKGNLKTLALDCTANFVVQHLIKACSEKLLFEEIYDELENSWIEIGSAGHMGVITSLSETCVRLVACQAKFVANLSKMLNCDGFSEQKFLFVPLVASLSTYDEWIGEGESERWNVNYHGSILIQNVLRFYKPFRAVESLLHTPVLDLMKIICHPFGSYVMEAFATSKTVSGVSRLNLVNQIKASLVDLVCDKFGSRCLESLFEAVDINGKYMIAEKLDENKNKLRSDPIGAFAVRTFALDLYKRSPNAWKDRYSRDVKKKKRELFNDILSSGSNNKRRK